MASDDELEAKRNTFFGKCCLRIGGAVLVIAPIPISSAVAGDLSWGDAITVIACAAAILVGISLLMFSLEW